MSEWKTYLLGDITEWFSGGTPLKSNESFWNGNIPWISARTLKNTRVSDSHLKISEEGLERGSKLAEIDDILLLVRGSGLFNSIPIAIVESPVAFNQDIKAIRITEEYSFISPWFLLYWFHANTRILNSIIKETGIGAGKFDLQLLKDLTIHIPPQKELIELTRTFKAIDDKIILLHQQNQTLEKLAQTLFKRWFVDFEFPNENDEPYKSSGGKMMASELGEIPEGWEISTIGDITINHDKLRKPLSKNQRLKKQGVYPYHGATSIMDFVDDYIFDGKYLLLGEDGSVVDENGYPYLQYVKGKFWVNNHAHVLEGKGSITTDYLYLLLSKTNISNIVTGAVQLKINQGNLNSIEVILPSKTVLESFNLLMSPIFSKIFNQKTEIQSLTKLRDTLLPKLMSGEMKIN